VQQAYDMCSRAAAPCSLLAVSLSLLGSEALNHQQSSSAGSIVVLCAFDLTWRQSVQGLHITQ